MMSTEVRGVAAPERTGHGDRTVRILLYVAGADAVVFLLAALVNLAPLLPLGGIVGLAAAASGVVLALAAAAAFVAAWFENRGALRWKWAPYAALANAVLIVAVAVYFSLPFQLFGAYGPGFLALALPGLVAAGIARRGHP